MLLGGLVTAACCLLLAWLFFRRPPPREKIATLVVIGSGGHAGEMLRLTQTLDTSLYDVTFVAATSDRTSQAKFDASPEALQGPWHRIPRAREVHQSWSSTFVSTSRALAASLRLVARLRPDLVVANGPGTCLPVCLVARLLGARLIFCESWCRVKRLSLTGRILYPLCHRFLVHWACLCDRYPRAEFIGHIAS